MKAALSASCAYCLCQIYAFYSRVVNSIVAHFMSYPDNEALLSGFAKSHNIAERSHAPMLHSALVTTDKANVLLARYFTPLTTEGKRVFEQALFKAVFSSTVSEHEAHLVVCDGQYVVYRKFGDLIWFLAGSGEYDELVCTSVATLLLFMHE